MNNNQTLWNQIRNISEVSGRFELRSGYESNTYFDKYQFECEPTLLNAVTLEMKKLVPSDTEILAGLELGGVPLAALLSVELGLPSVFVRKKAKEYWTMKISEGPDVAGKKICVIEDVVTTGGQIKISTKDLRQLGAIVDHAVCVIWRKSTDSNPLASVNLELSAVFSPVTASPTKTTNFD